MELLLSTPLPVRTILRGATLASRRLFGWPVFVLVALQLFLLALGLHLPHSSESGLMAFMVFANVVVFMADCWALHWAGLLAGFKSRQPHTAVWRTLLTVLALPWVGVWGVLALILFTHQRAEEGVTVFTWLCFSLAADVFFGVRAKWQLSRNLRTLALRRTTEGKAAT